MLHLRLTCPDLRPKKKSIFVQRLGRDFPRNKTRVEAKGVPRLPGRPEKHWLHKWETEWLLSHQHTWRLPKWEQPSPTPAYGGQETEWHYTSDLQLLGILFRLIKGVALDVGHM